MNDKELVSIIVPIYNAEKYIQRCVSSVLKQTYQYFEIILINDGSTDTSETLCNSFSDDRIRVFSKENGGVSSARNFGIMHAKGKYIMFLDADDYVDQNSLHTLIKCDTNFLCSLPVCTLNREKKKFSFSSNQVFSVDEYMKSIIEGKIGGFCWGYLFDAKIVKSMKFNESIKYMEDTLFLFEYFKKSNVKNINISVDNNYYNYYINSTSATNKKFNVLEKIQNMFFVLDSINIETNRNYQELIEYKKIRLLETEMRFLSNKSDYARMFDSITINTSKNMSVRYKIFSSFYLRKKYKCLVLYYYIRKKIKKEV